MATKTDSSPRTMDIALDRIQPDPEQPRKFFDPAKLQELAASMKTDGQLQAATVRYDRSTKMYTLIMGERRWRAARIAQLPTLRCTILHDIDEEDAFFKSVIENVARQDMTPLEEAKAFKRLLDAGRDEAEIARRVAKTVEHVTYRLDLLNLEPGAAEAVEKGHLPVGVAWYLARITADQQALFMGKWARGEFASARDAEAFAQACRNRNEMEQNGLFGMEEPSAEMRVEIHQTRQRVTSKVEQLAKAGEILTELARMDPEVLAKVLAGAAGGVDAYATRIKHIQDAASKASAKLRKASAINKVRVTEFQLIDTV